VHIVFDDHESGWGESTIDDLGRNYQPRFGHVAKGWNGQGDRERGRQGDGEEKLFIIPRDGWVFEVGFGHEVKAQ
jgi:hypothetical protein